MDLHVRASLADIRRTLRSLPRAAAGKESESADLARALLVRIGLAVLGRVKDAYVTKARGGTDAAGDRWAPLDPRTVKYRRKPARGKKPRKGISRPAEILRDTGRLLNSLSPALPADRATSNPPSVAGQVFQLDRGSVMIGTNVQYARYHHQGVPGRLPQRRLWPGPGRWPPGWWQDVLEQAQQGVAEIARHLLKG